MNAWIDVDDQVCTENGEKIALSRRVTNHWRYVVQICSDGNRLIGWGEIVCNESD